METPTKEAAKGPAMETEEEMHASAAASPPPPATTSSEPSADYESEDSDATTIKPAALPPFQFDNFDSRSLCRLPNCLNMTSCHDGKTVWCPACGPKSYVRYCSKAHLYEDLKRHHASECCTLAITGPINTSTILDSQYPARPYIAHGVFSPINPTSHLGTVERHRQAVYFAMEPEAEYFLFNDRSLLALPDNLVTSTNLETVRGSGQLIHRLQITEYRDSDTRRIAFSADLLRLLTYGATTLELRESATRVAAAIRLSLINSGLWEKNTIDSMCLQMVFEFGWAVPEEMTREVVE